MRPGELERQRKMNKYLVSMIVLMGAVSGYGSQVHGGNPSQFNVPKATKLARARVQAKLAAGGKLKSMLANPHQAQGQAQTPSRPKGDARASYANTSSSSSPVSLGLVSAKQIPAGGGQYIPCYGDCAEFGAEPYDQGYLGDFNGDGKLDVISVPAVYANGYVYSLAAVLSNGNGTFQKPILTLLTNNFPGDPLLIGDVNGDGKDDVIQVHFDNSPSTIDVWLSNGDGTFKAGNTYQISPAPLAGGMLTDANGDGKLDLVAIDVEIPGLVKTLLGNGDGTFQPTTSVTLPTQAPSDLIFADFNGDGKPDFAGIGTNGQVVVYLQAGGNFVQSGSPLSVSDSTYSSCGLAAGDLTGDGAAEVITLNCDSADENTVTVYMNNGSGSFSQGVYYNEVSSGGAAPANADAIAATVADVNGDGKNDIVVTCDTGHEIILLGNGDGTVKVPTVGYATGGFPTTAPLVADFNGDGLLDIMQPDNYYSYAYLQGYGDGTFRAALDYFGPINDGSWPESVAIATGDFNGDGVPDFAVGNCCSGSVGVTVFLSRGDGSLRPGVNYGSVLDAAGIAIADFNGDGKLDIAATSFDNATVQIFNGNGDGTFSVGSSYSTGGGDVCAAQIVAGDFNHDNHPDLAIANTGFWWCSDGPGNIGVLLNDGTGNFDTAVTYTIWDIIYTLAVGDLTGNGYLDLVVPGDYWNYYYVLMGNTNNSGTFQSPTLESLDNGSAFYVGPTGVTLADFNGDGKLDFAMTVEGDSDQGIAVALGNGDGTFQTPNLYSTTNQNFYNFEQPEPTIVQNADMNGDGILDLVYNNADFGTMGVLLGNGDGTFGVPNEYPTGSYDIALTIADVNGDGAPDVVTADDGSDGVTVLLNANGTAEKPDFALTAGSMSATVKAGAAATYDLSVAGKNGYAAAVTFTCSGLPAKAKCAFSPATVTTAGNISQATVLTISTTPVTSASLVQPNLVEPANPINSNRQVHPLLASLSGLGMFGCALALGSKRRRLSLVMGALLVGMTLTLVGCSSSSTPAAVTPATVAGTPAGTYTVVVTSTGAGKNAPTHSMNLTLVVQ
jgi:hypothetical protein